MLDLSDCCLTSDTINILLQVTWGTLQFFLSETRELTGGVSQTQGFYCY